MSLTSSSTSTSIQCCPLPLMCRLVLLMSLFRSPMILFLAPQLIVLSLPSTTLPLLPRMTLPPPRTVLPLPMTTLPVEPMAASMHAIMACFMFIEFYLYRSAKVNQDLCDMASFEQDHHWYILTIIMHIGTNCSLALSLLVLALSQSTVEESLAILKLRVLIERGYAQPYRISTVSIRAKVSPSHSWLLMVAKMTPIDAAVYTLSSLSALSSVSSPQLKYMDMVAAIGGQQQVINLAVTNGSADRVYIGIFNFDFPFKLQEKTVNITVQTFVSGKYCPSCSFGRSLIADGTLNCQCTPCPSSTHGPNCQYFVQELEQGKTTNLDLPEGNTFLRIASPPLGTIIAVQQVSATHSVRLYLQFESFWSELAGIFNVHYNGIGLSTIKLVTTHLNTFTVHSEGKPIILTFSNQFTQLNSVAITYTSSGQGESNTMVIVIAVVASVGGAVLGLLIFCCVIRKLKAQKVMDESSVNSEVIFLDQGSINRYFPAVLAGQTIPNNLIPSECAVCMTQVTQKSMVRVTYCRHFFHGHCFTQWLINNSSCPSCSKYIDLLTVRESYYQITGYDETKGGELVRAVFRDISVESQMNMSMGTLRETVGSRMSRYSKGNSESMAVISQNSDYLP